MQFSYLGVLSVLAYGEISTVPLPSSITHEQKERSWSLHSNPCVITAHTDSRRKTYENMLLMNAGLVINVATPYFALAFNLSACMHDEKLCSTCKL